MSHTSKTTPGKLNLIAVAFFVACVSSETAIAQHIAVERSGRGGQDGNQITEADDQNRFPSIRYGSTRRSNGWLTTKNGMRVGVDDGIEYDGIKVYMALTWHLVAVNQETKETVWSHNISAFWNEMAIEEFTEPTGDERAEEDKTIVVALRTGRDDETADLVERYELKTGEKLKQPTASPEGESIKIDKQFYGANCGCEKPLAELVTDVERWKELYNEHFEEAVEDIPAEDLFNDETHCLLVLSSGNSYNCRGISAGSVFESDERFLIRIHRHTYQSDGDTPQVQPYGVIVLPKDKTKKYIVESNRQSFIGGPPLWKKVHEFEIDEP